VVVVGMAKIRLEESNEVGEEGRSRLSLVVASMGTLYITSGSGGGALVRHGPKNT